MADLTVKRWDTFPALQATLSDLNGFINLTAATQVKVIMKGTTGASPALVTGVMSIASAGGGYVTYGWAKTDLSIADTYNTEFEIAWQAGGIETVPSNGYNTVVVMPDLEGG